MNPVRVKTAPPPLFTRRDRKAPRARPRRPPQRYATRRSSAEGRLALTNRGGRERTLQFRQRLTFELARTFARDRKLATNHRQRMLFAIEAEAQFDHALFALGQRPHRSDDGAPPRK
jgi:hypothetical protein